MGMKKLDICQRLEITKPRVNFVQASFSRMGSPTSKRYSYVMTNNSYVCIIICTGYQRYYLDSSYNLEFKLSFLMVFLDLCTVSVLYFHVF